MRRNDWSAIGRNVPPGSRNEAVRARRGVRWDRVAERERLAREQGVHNSRGAASFARDGDPTRLRVEPLEAQVRSALHARLSGVPPHVRHGASANHVGPCDAPVHGRASGGARARGRRRHGHRRRRSRRDGRRGRRRGDPPPEDGRSNGDAYHVLRRALRGDGEAHAGALGRRAEGAALCLRRPIDPDDADSHGRPRPRTLEPTNCHRQRRTRLDALRRPIRRPRDHDSSRSQVGGCRPSRRVRRTVKRQQHRQGKCGPCEARAEAGSGSQRGSAWRTRARPA